MGVRVGVANFLLGQSISIDEASTFEIKFFASTVCGRDAEKFVKDCRDCYFLVDWGIQKS